MKSPSTAGSDATRAQSTFTHGDARPEYSIERLCFHLYEPFQLKFARHAQRVLREHGDVDAEASHRGLVLRGETEAAIEGAVELLEEYFGNQIRVESPRGGDAA